MNAPSKRTLPTREQLEDARRIVYSVLPPTPQRVWPLLSQRLGAEVWVKHENHLPTGAFKVRGGLVYFDELLKREPNCPGVISATRGNHGQSVGFAAARAGLPVTIVVPHGNSREKNAAMRALGVELIEHGTDFQESREYAARLATERGLHMIPSYHPALVRGVATGWLELFEAVPNLDVLFVPIGMGSGICAAAAARQATGVATRIVGVVSSLAPAYALSFAKGEAIEAPATTRLADGMACRQPDATALALIRAEVESIVQVSDEEVANAMRLYFTDTHNVAEGAGAAGLAAAIQLGDAIRGQRIGLSLCGANVDREVFADVLMRPE